MYGANMKIEAWHYYLWRGDNEANGKLY